MYNYYFAIASKNFLIKEEPLEEILRERTGYYKSINKDIDFWLVLNPAFIDLPELYSVKKQIADDSAAIVSFDKKFIQWLKLRVSFVITGNFQSKSLLEIESK
uniref:Ycf54 n=1 Tax=Grateloupia turuturu TaxID=118375 RepID=A0A6B9P5G8_9FLOR|nr:Ycf54 [Grateloupia turuturu]QHD45223.1 Ycf54 [Grateloupia turuturu]UXC96767.1 Ycf54 [Grateloupia turuturu]